jgi:lipocalin
MPVKAVFVVLALAVLAAGCSDKKPAPPANRESSEAILKRDCADEQWKQQNLGLWYSVCRTPMRW